MPVRPLRLPLPFYELVSGGGHGWILHLCARSSQGHLVDTTVYRYCNIPALHAGLLMLADSGFPAGSNTLVAVRCGQMPHIPGKEVNR